MGGKEHNHEHSPDPLNTGRRRFCKAAIGGTAAITIGTVVYPIVAFLDLPMRLGEDKPVEIPLDRLTRGQAYYADFHGQQVIVVMSDDGPRVFDAACTHLGCNVMWDTAQGVFHCPCHGAVFSNDGQVVSGPVSQPLRELPFEVQDGTLIIS